MLGDPSLRRPWGRTDREGFRAGEQGLINSRRVARALASTLAASLLSVGAPHAGVAQDASDPAVPVAKRSHPGRVLARFKRGTNPERWLERRGMRTLRRHRVANLRSISLDRSRKTARKALEELRASGLVEYAELDPVVHAEEVVPNDPLFPQLWHLRNLGVGEDINATLAWERVTGDPGVVVGVVDTGVDFTHPDLAANMWSNPGEQSGVGGVDDDQNGYVDDIHGINCNDQDPDPTPRDRNGHGTHVAGTLAAVGDNGVGVTGVAWRSSIMALRFLDSRGLGFLSDAIECLDYAIEMKTRAVNPVNLRVANNSWGGAPFSLALRDVIQQANDAGVLFVAAAGNDGENNDGNPHYPSSYPLPNVVAVAASNVIDALTFFSNYGAVSVDLAAPGSGILSTLPGEAYGQLNGTSMATPQVSGAAALIYSKSPDASPAGVRQRLLGTVRQVGALQGRVASGGRLDLAGAVCDPGELTLGLPDLPVGFRKLLRRTRVLHAELFDCGEPVHGALIQVFFSNGDPTLQLRDDGVAPDEVAGDGIYMGGWFAETLGAVTVRVLVTLPGTTIERLIEGTVRVIPNYLVDHAVPFGWVETAGGVDTGVRQDDAFLEIPIGFPFAFFTQHYDLVKVSSNGYLTFGGPAIDWSNGTLPSVEDPNALIAVYWDDLDPSAGGVIRYLAEGTAPDRRLTVEWRDVPYFASPAAATFQVTLYELDQHMELRYLQVESGDPFHDRGGSATIGLEDEEGQQGVLVSLDAPSLRNGDAIAISFEPPFCAIGPDADGDGLCDADDNCPFAPNGDQADRGGISRAVADGIGDVCQCGDVTGNGVVNSTDGLAISRQTLGLPSAGFRVADLCDVGGVPGCTATDGLIVTQASVFTGPGIQQVCPRAVPSS